MLRAELGHPRRVDFELDVAFDVAAGRCLALAGPSGAGKTTVLRLLAGTVRPDRGGSRAAGDVWVDTDRRSVWTPPEERRCGYVFQDYALFPHLSAWRNVAYGLRACPRASAAGEAHGAARALRSRRPADARPATLSGGERQRVALARALAPRADACCCSTSRSSALDARTRARRQPGAGRDAALAGGPVVLVTHDFDEAALLGDEVGVIDAGRMIQQGSASELAAAPASAFVADFTGAVVLDRHAWRRPPASSPWSTWMAAAAALEHGPRRGPRRAQRVSLGDHDRQPEGARADDSAQNRLTARVTSVTAVGNRVRVGLSAGSRWSPR